MADPEPTVDQVDDRVSRAQRTGSEARELLERAAPPFQLFVVTVRGATVVLDGVRPSTRVRELAERLQDREGIPVDQQRLVYGGRTLDLERSAADVGLGADATVHLLLRLVGGLGEGPTVERVSQLTLRRGNVGHDVIETEGYSFALTRFGRTLGNGAKLRGPIAERLGIDPQEVGAWWKENGLHVSALVTETLMSGNCGEFSQVVASDLVATTTDQFVYEVILSGRCSKDDCDYEVDHVLNHQVCVTYPLRDGQVTRDANAMRTLRLEDMDPRVANVIDAWHSHRIVPLADWLKEGGNLYHELELDDLQIDSAHPCTGEPVPPELRRVVCRLVEEALTTYVSEDPQYVCDVFLATWREAARGLELGPVERVEAQQRHAQELGLRWDAVQRCREEVWQMRRDAVRDVAEEVHAKFVLGGPQYLEQIEGQLLAWGAPEPMLLAFFEAVADQRGVEAAIDALVGASSADEAFEQDWAGLATFDVSALTDTPLDLRTTRDRRRALVLLPKSNWKAFVKEALEVGPEALVSYALRGPTSLDRVLRKEPVRLRFYEHLLGPTPDGGRVEVLKSMAPAQLVAFALHSDATQALVARLAWKRLARALREHLAEEEVATVIGRMTKEQLRSYVEFGGLDQVLAVESASKLLFD